MHADAHAPGPGRKPFLLDSHRSQEPVSARLVGQSLQMLVGEDVDFSKWHVFFTGERLDGQDLGETVGRGTGCVVG